MFAELVSRDASSARWVSEVGFLFLLMLTMLMKTRFFFCARSPSASSVEFKKCVFKQIPAKDVVVEDGDSSSGM